MAILKKYQKGGVFHVTPDAPGKVFLQKGDDWSVSSDGKTFEPMMDTSGERKARILKYGHKDPLLNKSARTPIKLANDPSYKEFQNTVKYYENGIKAGVKDGKYYPYQGDENKKIFTVGFGHKVIEGEDFSKGLTKKEADALFQKDLLKHTEQARSLVDSLHGDKAFYNLPVGAKKAIVDMTFNMGKNKLKEFKNFFTAMQNKNNTSMADESHRDKIQEARNQWVKNILLNTKF
jgi:lysozyme